MITIINYGSGNINAIGNIYERLNIQFSIANRREDIYKAGKIILPGVGSFDETIAKLDQSGFRQVLDEAVLKNKIPVLGICVGMQILSNRSEEGQLNGLGWIKGNVNKIDKSLLKDKPKIPHLGWNSVEVVNESKLFKDVDYEKGFYFLHSYYFECASDADILAKTVYGKTFTSAVNHENIYGVQFHPEKSHQNGVQLLKNFVEL